MIGKRVAVKMLRPDLGTDPGLVSRFFQEARAVNEIRHPNIVDISDFGKTRTASCTSSWSCSRGAACATASMPKARCPSTTSSPSAGRCVMHCRGPSGRHRPPRSQARQHLPACRSRAAGRAAQQAVRLRRGQAAGRAGKAGRPQDHRRLGGGTPFYMSPEQALCQDVGAAADIYAMGVVMFEMVTGRVRLPPNNSCSCSTPF